MSHWNPKPFIYQINTWVWLHDLSKKYGREVTLWDVPDEILNDLASLSVDAIWFMGIWQRSEAAHKSALNYIHEYKHALPDATPEDVVGSAYAIADYVVDIRLGGRDALANLRWRLHQRKIKIILDYVPNHVSTDHHWLRQKPHYMVRGTKEDIKKFPDRFFTTENESGQQLIIGHGRDPNFPGWIDTAQVNAFSLAYRVAAAETLFDIATQCDGVRCDMAMLMTNTIFARTWGAYLTETAPNTEFWDDIIPAIKREFPDFVFIAEVYWDMEYTMLQQGFDFTYDKRLYDRILEGDIPKIKEHLRASFDFQARQVRFIENHDEQRAASTIGINKSRPAITLISTLPGSVLLHEGQLTARKVKLPVQIRRRPDEAPNYALEGFYRKLLRETRSAIYHYGNWRLFDVAPPYKGNTTNAGLLAYGWTFDDDFRVIIVNMTPLWSQGIVKLYGWDFLRDGVWRLYDVLGGVSTFHEGEQLSVKGLYVELEVYQAQVFRFERLTTQEIESLRKSRAERR
ncbi:MAG: alpha-amylase family glycosyl hydrolase [Phototrophicales bacterium]|nr:alpha-amylase family glycosyl hydrolase [Phototrophicales bacterium]